MGLPIFLKQLALRTSAIFIVKLIGALARIPLFRLLGAEGVGLYQMAYSFYGLVLILIVGGFPTALSLAAAKEVRQGKVLLKLLLCIVVIIGGIVGYISYMFAPAIASLIGDDHVQVAIECVAPALVVVPLLQLIRGFLQGIEYYGSIAASEIVEQVVRVGTMLLLSTLWLTYGYSFAVGGAVFGAFTGAVCALLFLLAVLLYFFTQTKEEGKGVPSDVSILFSPGIRVFMYTSVAIFATRLIVPLSEFLDALIIPHRLQDAGLSVSQATAVFGEIFGMATTVVYLPTMITAAISHTLAAKITDDWEKKRMQSFFRRSRLAIHLGWLCGVCSALFLFYYAEPLSVLLFGDRSAALAVQYLSIVPIITGVREITTTILWAKEKEKEPIIGLVIGTLCSVTVGYCVVGIPGFGYEGAALSIVSLECMAAIWNIRALKKESVAIFRLLPFVMETTVLLFIGSLYFISMVYFLRIVAVSIPLSWQWMGQMFLFYSGLVLYAIFRFLRANKLKIFL